MLRRCLIDRELLELRKFEVSVCPLCACEGSWAPLPQEYVPIDKAGKTSHAESITSVDFTRQRMVREGER